MELIRANWISSTSAALSLALISDGRARRRRRSRTKWNFVNIDRDNFTSCFFLFCFVSLLKFFSLIKRAIRRFTAETSKQHVMSQRKILAPSWMFVPYLIHRKSYAGSGKNVENFFLALIKFNCVNKFNSHTNATIGKVIRTLIWGTLCAGVCRCRFNYRQIVSEFYFRKNPKTVSRAVIRTCDRRCLWQVVKSASSSNWHRFLCFPKVHQPPPALV